MAGSAAGKGPRFSYSPFDAAYPVNIYGASKLQFEGRVLQLPHGYVLRLSNMIGPSCVFQRPAGGAKFLQFLNEAFQSRQFIGLKADERRSFVFVGDVVDVFLALVIRHRDLHRAGVVLGADSLRASASSRILNVGGPESLSRLDLAVMLSKEMGVEILVYRMKDFKVKLDTNASSGTGAGAGSDGGKMVDKSTPWEVYTIANDPPKAGELKSPKDITMDSSSTEKLLKLEFRKLQPLLRASVLN